jgi:oxygen-independent coproporphyrinogen-3 oxidase
MNQREQKTIDSRPAPPEETQTASAQDPRRISAELRRKYDVRGPRYTSYPPATHFGEIDTAELHRRWREGNALDDDPGLSLYFHIPFCRARCLFCGCHTLVGKGDETVQQYIEAMVSEMELAAKIVDPDRPVRQVAFGGGTPNYLELDQIKYLLSQMHRIWKINEGAELSVEINPRTSTPEKLNAFLESGFNRFSLGIQDFNKEVLQIIQRSQGLMEVEEVITHLRKNGCERFNFDLIYGLPGQTLESVGETARIVRELRPSRIALYSYAHVPWIQPHQKALEEVGLPDPDLKVALFLTMVDRLLEAGYESIGMDHFALPEDPLTQALKRRTLRRNFMGYTTGRGLDLLAFGASAISSIGTTYSQNHKQPEEYIEEIGKSRLPVVRGFLLNKDDEIRRELILELFCNFHADLEALSKRFSIDATDYLAEDLRKLEPLAADRLVSWTPNAIEVTDTGRFFIRNICMTFDRYLEKDASSRMYSRTV